jgi:hypothetical protein
VLLRTCQIMIRKKSPYSSSKLRYIKNKSREDYMYTVAVIEFVSI